MTSRTEILVEGSPEAAKLWLVLDSQLGVGVKKTFLFWDDVWVPFKGGECEKNCESVDENY